MNPPIAHALPAEVAATPLRELSLPALPRFGLAACRHVRPFQRRMRAWFAPPLKEMPATQTSQGESTAVPKSVFSAVPGFQRLHA